MVCIVYFFAKIVKKSQFTLKRKKFKFDEFEADDWVCPAFDPVYGDVVDKSVSLKVSAQFPNHFPSVTSAFNNRTDSGFVYFFFIAERRKGN